MHTCCSCSWWDALCGRCGHGGSVTAGALAVLPPCGIPRARALLLIKQLQGCQAAFGWERVRDFWFLSFCVPNHSNCVLCGLYEALSCLLPIPLHCRLPKCKWLSVHQSKNHKASHLCQGCFIIQLLQHPGAFHPKPFRVATVWQRDISFDTSTLHVPTINKVVLWLHIATRCLLSLQKPPSSSSITNRCGHASSDVRRAIPR
jgi:hypothetical protein